MLPDSALRLLSRNRTTYFGIAAFLMLSACQSTESIVSKAQSLAQEKKFEEAEIQFRRAIQKDQSSASATIGLADALRQQGKGQEALATYLRAYELSGGDVETQKRVAQVLLNTYLINRTKPKAIYDELSRISKQFLQRNPQSFEGLQIRGTLAMEDKNYPAAVEDLQKAHSLQQGNEMLNLTLIEALASNRQSREAEELALKLIAANPQNAPVYNRLYWIYVEGKRVAEAGKLLERQIATRPSDSRLVLRLAKHVAELEGDRERARTIVNNLLEDAGRYPDGPLAAGRAYLDAQRFDEAMNALKKGLDRNDSLQTDYLKLLAECYVQTGKRDLARQQLAEASKKKPSDKTIPYAEAILYLLEGTSESAGHALQLLDRLQAEGFSDSQLGYHRARALFLVNKPEEGAKLLQEILQRQKGNIDARFALAGYYANRQRYNDALRLVEEVEVLSPDNESAVLARIGLLRRLNRLDEARNLLQQAKKRLPDSDRLTLEDGLLALDQKRFDLAASSFQRLYDSGAKVTQIVAGLAQSYLGLGRSQQALALIDKELQLHPENVGLRAMRGDLLSERNDLPGAIAEYESIAKAGEAGTIVRRSLGKLYFRAKRYAESAQIYSALAEAKATTPTDNILWLQSAIETNDSGSINKICGMLEPQFKTDWVSANNCAFAMAEAGGDLSRAETLIRPHIKPDKKTPNLQDTLAYIQIKQGKYPEALSTLNELSEEHKTNPSFRFHRGLALAGLRRNQEAQQDYVKAASLTRDPGLLKRIDAAKMAAGK